MFDNIRKRLDAYVKRLSKFKPVVRRWDYRIYLLIHETPRTLFGRVRWHLHEHWPKYATGFYAVVAVAAITLLYKPMVGSDQDTITGFMYGSAAMFGGMLAIVFTFNTLIINFAVDQYPPEFYRLSGYNRALDTVYFALGSLTLAQFLMGISYHEGHGSKGIILAAAVAAVFVAVYLLYAAFVLVRGRMNPIAGLARIRDRAIKILDTGDKYAKRYVATRERDPDLDEQKRKMLPYQPYLHLYRSYEDLSKYLAYLGDYHTKLVEKANYQTALSTVDVIVQILIKYMDVNKHSMPPLHNGGMLDGYTTMGERFMNINYERLQAIARYYVARDDGEALAKVAKSFTDLATKSLEMEFPLISGQRRENPEFSRCVGYMAIFCDELTASKSVNAIFYFTEAMGICGQLAITHGLHLDASLAYKKLDALALVAAQKGYSSVFSQMSDAFVALAGKCIDHRATDRDIKAYFETLNKVVRYFLIANGSGDIRTAGKLLSPYKIFAQSALKKVADASNSAVGNRDQLQLEIIHTVEQVREAILGLARSQTLIDYVSVLDLSEVLEALSTNLVPNLNKRTWQRNASRLEDVLVRLAYVHPFLSHDAKQIDNNFVDTVADRTGRVALNATQHKQANVAKAAIQSVKILAEKLLVLSKRADYDAPRMMVGVAALAIVALELEQADIAAYCRDAVREFNAKYIKAMYPKGISDIPVKFRGIPPYPNQLFAELKQSYQNYNDHNWGSGNSLPMYDPGLDEIIAKMAGRTQQDYIAVAKFLKHKS